MSSSSLRAVSMKVELPRFMGKWFVVGFNPIDLPFIGEAGAHDAVEEYRLDGDGSIATTYTFRDGSFDGPRRRMTPRAWVHDTTTNAEWRMQLVWPLKSAYLIAALDPDYRTTIVGVPDRSNVWLMARYPNVSLAEYDGLVQQARLLGHDPRRIRRVPHRDVPASFRR